MYAALTLAPFRSPHDTDPSIQLIIAGISASEAAVA